MARVDGDRVIKKRARLFMDLLNPTDWIVAVYALLSGLFIIIFRASIPNWSDNILVRVVGAVAVYVLIYADYKFRNKVLLFFRSWYPAILLSVFHSETHFLNTIIFQDFIDDFLIQIDLWMFGTNPNVWMYDHLRSQLVSEILHLCYFLYYLLVPFLGLQIYFRNRVQFHKLLFAIIFTFHLCYSMYVFIPAAGPREEGRQGRFQEGGVFVEIMDGIYAGYDEKHQGKHGAAFPSSHVAIAFLILMFAFKFDRRSFYIVLPVVIGLIISTVYGFYHYVIDILPGILVAVVCFYLCNYWYDRFLEERFDKYLDR